MLNIRMKCSSSLCATPITSPKRINMDKEIRKIEKETKKVGKDLKSLEKADKKRDKVVKVGKKAMKHKPGCK